MNFEYWVLAILGGTLASSIYLNYRLLKHISTTKEYNEYIDSTEYKEDVKEFIEEESDPVELSDEVEYYRDIELKKRGY